LMLHAVNKNCSLILTNVFHSPAEEKWIPRRSKFWFHVCLYGQRD